MTLDDVEPWNFDDLMDDADDGRVRSLEASYERPDSDGVASLHDVEAEAGEDTLAQDLFSVDHRAAAELGIDLDTIPDEPVID